MLDQGEVATNTRLCEIFLERILELSRQKFSSNVIEKCLMQSPQSIKQKMIGEISKGEYIAPMLLDQYANYVLQRVMSLAAPDQLHNILLAIQPALVTLRKSPNGVRIYSKLTKKYPELSNH